MKRILLFSLMLFFVLSNGACQKKDSAEETVSEPKSGLAPDFVLKDLSGSDIRLSQFRGKVVVLEFWATWCHACDLILPELIAIHKQYSDMNVEVLGISLDKDQDPSKKVLSFSREHGIPYRILLGNKSVERNYEVFSIPAIFIIDKEGKIQKSYKGYTDDMRNLISDEIARLR